MSRDPARALTQFFGGRICLDFANTVDWRTSKEPQELIPDYAAFLSWSHARHTLPQAAVERLQRRAVSAPAAAAAALQQAHALRAELWRIATVLCRRGPAQLAPLNHWLTQIPAQPRLISEAGRYVHELPGGALDEPLRPVLWSVSALLTSEDAARVGTCSAQDCGWFFVDESPAHSRRWCSGEVCGNRERARRAYARRRTAPAGSSRQRR